MTLRLRTLLAWCLAALVAAPALGEDVAPEGDELGKPAAAQLLRPLFVEPQFTWSATALADINIVSSEGDRDGEGSFFDQYAFVPNKSSSFPIELGVRDARFDWIDDRKTPVLQIRYDSPNSNLSLSPTASDERFLNQQLELHGRRESLALDLRYRRMRSEELRLFPETAGAALEFEDRSSSSDRFQQTRTGVEGELRIRPLGFVDHEEGGLFDRLAPELSLRGGHEDREGQRQVRFLRPVTADWLGLSQPMDRSLSRVGGGLLLIPWLPLTVTVDFDHERLRWDSNRITEGDLGYPAPESSRAVRFVPETDRSTGTVRVSGRIGDRARFGSGFSISRVEQTGDRTPNQRSAGLDFNRVTYHSANAALDVSILDALSFDAHLKFDQRKNGIERDTDLFAPDNGTQTGVFIRNWRRYVAGGEFVYRMPGANRIAAGLRFEDIERDIDFAEPGTTFLRVVPANGLVGEDTRMVTVYGKTSLRPTRGLRLAAELGYREAPRTGYVSDLDDYVYGKLRATYVVPLPRMMVVSAHVHGSEGRNRDFALVSGTGAQPEGPEVSRKFDRSSLDWGLTLTGSPVDDVSLFASFFHGRDDQDSSFTVSTLQRYWQDNVPITFSNAGVTRFDSRHLNLIVGAHARIGEQTEGSLRYAFTRVETRFGDDPDSSELQSIRTNRRIDSDTHGIHLELRHWLRDGLRVAVGYGLQIHDDRGPVPESVTSRVEPSDRSVHQHRVTLGVTLTQELMTDAD